MSGVFLPNVCFNLLIILTVSSELLDHNIYILGYLISNSNNLTIILVLLLKFTVYFDNEHNANGILSEYSIKRNGCSKVFIL